MKLRGAIIGTFDGVHRGHVSVIDTLLELCQEKGLEPVAITFDKHPLAHIAPHRTPPTITTTEKKCELLKSYKISPIVFTFDESLRRLTAEEWMKKIYEELGVRLIVLGYDNTFGCDGGSLSLSKYQEIGKLIGIEVVQAQELEGISSSAIREAILTGNVEKATEMSGRHHSIAGLVVAGNRLGRKLGYPTANLSVADNLALPSAGVYAAIASLPDGSKLPAMVNIGRRPTIDSGNEKVIEAHIIGFSGDLYGKEVKLRFISRLRDEIKFDSLTQLQQQLDKDKEHTLNAARKH